MGSKSSMHTIFAVTKYPNVSSMPQRMKGHECLAPLRKQFVTLMIGKTISPKLCLTIQKALGFGIQNFKRTESFTLTTERNGRHPKPYSMPTAVFERGPVTSMIRWDGSQRNI